MTRKTKHSLGRAASPKKRAPRRKTRRSTQRRLKLETLDQRQLLAANIFFDGAMPPFLGGLAAQLPTSRARFEANQATGAGDATLSGEVMDEAAIDSSTDAEVAGSDDSTEQTRDVVLQWNDLFGEILADSVVNQTPAMRRDPWRF